MSTSYTEAWLTGHCDNKFYTRTYNAPQTPKAVLVFVHGFAEHVGRHAHVHARLAERGVAVFAYDGRGFGRTVLDEQHRSPGSSFGKTNWKDQFADIEWAIRHVKTEFDGTPIFLMGASMGGGNVIGFATRGTVPPSRETVALLSGVIASSPLIHLSNLTTWIQVQRGAARIVRHLVPNMPIPAPVNPPDLSHDPERNRVLEDPLIKQQGTIAGLADMFDGGEALLSKDYIYWPKALPIIILHGTADKITSPKASEAFINKIQAHDKKLSLYEGGYHELFSEPDGVWQTFADECISWIEAHTSSKL